MPYYRCASCRLTVYSGAGYSTARDCPNCGTELGDGARLLLPREQRRKLRLVPLESRAGAGARREFEPLGG
jgi:hypothetical protein